MVGIAGVTTSETNAAGETVIEVEPLMVPDVAVTEVLPTCEAVAFPLVSTEAMEESAVLHVTVVVRSWVLPSV